MSDNRHDLNDNVTTIITSSRRRVAKLVDSMDAKTTKKEVAVYLVVTIATHIAVYQ